MTDPRVPEQQPVPGTLHHVELWVPELDRGATEWGWLLMKLGYEIFQQWDAGVSWRLGHTYLVVERSAAMVGDEHDRLRPGLNHLAVHAGPPAHLDVLMATATHHGWSPLFAEKYPHAGGPDQYAGYLANSDGFEVELVAT